MEEKKRLMLARLSARKAEREAESAQRKAKLAETSDPHEGQATWWAKFKPTVSALEAAVARASKEHAGKGRRNKDAAQALHALAEGTSKLQELVSDGSRFLPKFDQKTAQATVKRLERAVREAKAIIVPRGKFSFGKAGEGRVRRRGARAAAAALRKENDEKAAVLAASSKVSFDYCEKTFKGERGATLRILPGELRAEKALGSGGLPAGPSKSSNSQDVALVELENCTVSIREPLKGLRAHKLTRCHVYCGPIDGSVFIEGCRQCVFHFPSRQIRIHHTYDTGFYVHVQSGPIVEDCDALRFAPYTLRYPGLEADYVASPGLSLSVNRWREVKDFKWLRAQHSPHWSLIPEAERTATTRTDDFKVCKGMDTLSLKSAIGDETDLAGGRQHGPQYGRLHHSGDDPGV